MIGFSSHDNGISMPLVAYMLGARIVEKHFTLNRAWKGTDHKFSLEPQGMRKLVRDLERAYVALGDGTKTMYPSESEPIRKMGKMIVAARDLPAGHVVARDDLALKSPGRRAAAVRARPDRRPHAAPSGLGGRAAALRGSRGAAAPDARAGRQAAGDDA